MNQPVKDSKTKLLESFQRLLSERQRIQSRVATKEEEAEQLKDQQILAEASTYTVDSIIKGLADLQLDFGVTVTQLSEKVADEMTRLEDLQRSYAVETRKWQELQDIRIAADALYLLTQDHQETLRRLEQTHAEQREALTRAETEQRQRWQREDQEFVDRIQEINSRFTHERQRLESDFTYELGRQRQMELDACEEKRRTQERDLLDEGQAREKNWTERQAFLTKHHADLQANLGKIEAFPTELDQAVKKARAEAIEEINREAKVKADLIEKEWSGSKQGFDLKIQSLEQVIQRQTEQIGQLSAQLQAAMHQAQDLAMRAFASAPGKASTN